MIENNYEEYENELIEQLEEYKKPDGKKKEECCVCINVFTKCDKKHCKKDHKFCDNNKDKKDKEEDCCVCVNIYTECK